ncbi:MAG TPA: FAD-dependent oxidoreductase [Pirellulales bacterium]|nr:FAD-dependent oxidoreductase [Pirellulales bacterium]
MAKVIVLGGGVAGLSAAHELVERGFQVEVYERRHAIWGGKARSMDQPNSGIAGRKNLPGEHGFRFFPGFYKHLPDTMRRIPFPGNAQGVFGNLVAATQAEMFQERADPILLPVQRPQTLQDWIEAVREIAHAHTGVPRVEADFFFERLLVILTSCQERRLAEYEKLAWWKFIDADDMSAAYQKILGQGLTRSLVAMRAEVASTRTVGDILLQLILSGLTGGEADRVLNGPTNDVWIDPWARYLTGRGVALALDAEVRRIHFNGASVNGVDVLVADQVRTVVGDYYVFAVPVEVMSPLVSPVMAAAAPSLAQLARLHTEWMNGIQFYLNRDVPLDRGHAIYLDSAWALTSISQHPFWPGVDLAQYGDGTVRGILSVDISDWFAPGNQVVHLPAHQCTAQQIKDEVWAQLKAHLNRPGRTVLEDAHLVGWHLDPDITFPRNSPPNDENREPLLVNLANSWQYRPEAAVEIPNLFLASDYIRTETDLATMEGANEAARRAVNAILIASGSNARPCGLWPLHEPDVFAPLRDYDLIRFRLGLPHASFP